ncbi:hypothetical protein [Chelatococcus reniformis]|uniref:Tail protein n=1 Tax=Chelatococcus reniformis TaxID=1494448 RepID=A0A916UF25_9HYPH|nr:hypothetical protein [Chelatococcus reniformis]GGC68623.1 tail protein [Chelatococcus reniformis]
MPSVAELCEVRTEAGIFRDWTSVLIQQSYESHFARQCRLQLAEPTASGKGGASVARVFRLKPGDRTDIALAGKLIIQEGRVKARQASYDATRHGVQVDILSKAGTITDVSVDAGGGQYRNYSYEAIASSILKPFGLKFRLENPPDGAQERFPNVIVQHGETPFELLARLARQRGLWLKSEADGTIVGGVPDKGSGFTFEEGRNILAASCYIEKPEVTSVIAKSQQPGSDSLFGKEAAQVSARAKMADGDGQTRTVLAEEPLSQRGAQLRANMEASALIAANLRVSLTYQGWLRPDNGQLWELGEEITVKSPMLFPTDEGQATLRVWAVAYSQETNAGSQTTLDLVNEKAFSLMGGDASRPGPFAPSATPAQPETLT